MLRTSIQTTSGWLLVCAWLFTSCKSDLDDTLFNDEPEPQPAPSSPVDDDQPDAAVDPAPADDDTVEPPAPSVRPDAGPMPTPTTTPPMPDGGPPLLTEAGKPQIDDAATPGPVLELVSSLPAQDATAVDPATHIELVFNVTLTANDGEISVFDPSGVVESIATDDPRIMLEESTVRLDLDGILAPNTPHSIRVPREVFTGPQGEILPAAATILFTTDAVEVPGGVEQGLLVWLDAAYSQSLKTGETGIRLWADRSGNHLDATQATAAARPVLDASGINSEPALAFDGSDDVLVTPTLPLQSAYDGFMVWQSANAPTTTTTSLLLRSERALELAHGHASPIARRAVSAFDGSMWHSTAFGTPSEDVPMMWNFSQTSLTQGLYARSQGGAPVVTLLPAAAHPPQAPWSIGAGDGGEAPFEGLIGELLVYDRVLSADERARVVSDLRGKWGFSDPVCASNEELGPDGTCYFVEPGAATWSAALTACEERGLGWGLAAIQSSEQNDFVGSLLDAQGWLGGSDQTTADSWTWRMDGLVFWSGDASGSAQNDAFTNWNGTSPEGAGDCLLMLADGTWSDAPCDESNAAICQGPGG